MPVNSFENYPMNWKPIIGSSGRAIYRELAMQLEADIKNGILKPGMMLPPQRELADYLDINLSTVTRAFKLCEQKGLISGATGRGTFVASDISNAILLGGKEENRLIEMGAILPDEEQNRLVVKTMQKLLKEPDAFHGLQYGLTEDNLLQKKAAVQWLEKSGFRTSPERILFAAGGQNAISGILASLFRCGDKIGTTTVIYPGIKTAASMLGLKLIPVADADGEIDPDILEQICVKEGIKALYLIADYHNPTTKTMKLETRKAIAEIAVKHELIVLEDAINSLLMEKPLPPIASFAPEHTIYISSVSKTLSPGLRTAFVASPLQLHKELSIGFYNLNIMVSPLLTKTTVRLIDTGAADEIVKQRREGTRKRNRMISEILHQFDVQGDDYCNFRWLMLPQKFTGMTFELYAKNAGVQLYAAERFAIGSRHPQAVRIAVTAEQSIDEFLRGIGMLKNILESTSDFTYF